MRFSWVRLGWVREEGREEGRKQKLQPLQGRRGLVVVEEVMHTVTLFRVGFLFYYLFQVSRTTFAMT